MNEEILEVGLFAVTATGTTILGHTRDADLVELVRSHVASNQARVAERLLKQLTASPEKLSLPRKGKDDE